MKTDDYARNKTWARSYQTDTPKGNRSIKLEFSARDAKIERSDTRSGIVIKKSWKWDEFDENPEANFESALSSRDTYDKKYFHSTGWCEAN